MSDIRPVDTSLLRNLREHVHEQLRRLIVAGRFGNGEKLNERQLAEQLGVSTTPVKDAIRRLESEGLVYTAPRRGVYVTFSAQQALEMAIGRAMIEGVMAHVAAHRITAEQLAELRGQIDRMAIATDHAALEDLIDLNEAFHGAIHRISACTYLTQRLDGQRMYDRAQRLSLLAEEGERQQGFIEHKLIFEALAARQPQSAESCMRSHIIRSARRHVAHIFGTFSEGLPYGE